MIPVIIIAFEMRLKYMLKDIQDEIIRLKKEKDICILAHSYQAREIIEVADFSGDSYALSVMASKAPQKTVIMCGVRFMAETVKILPSSPWQFFRRWVTMLSF
jgi:quinolinate synthase